MIKYIVELGYTDFVFDTADEAMDFAVKARMSAKKGDDLEVTIRLINADAKDEEEEEE